MENSTPKWDLSDLFSSIEDPKVLELIDDCQKRSKDFRAKYYNHIADFAEPKKLLSVIEEYENLLTDLSKLEGYSELVFSTDTANVEIGAFLQKIRTSTVEAFSELIFFELELLQLTDEEFKAILTSEVLAKYKHYFEKMYAWKPHRLSEKEEKILEYKSLTGKQALSRFFEQELAKQKFEIELNGEKKIFNESETLNLLHTEKDQKEREKIAKGFTNGLLAKESIFTFVFNTLAEDKKINDKLLNFSFPEESRHLTNEANAEAVESMVKVVEESYKLAQEYYTFKKEVLGLEKMYDYDRYAPINAVDKTIEYQDAKKIILKSFESFAKYFSQTASKFFDGNWIDAALAYGKRGGAYCMRISPQEHPYVFMNYAGSINDVMTLAHELGHGVNFELARKQVLLNYGSPLTLSETASIFAESLVFKELVDNEQDNNVLLSLYMKRLEGIFASVHRQVSMYRFEQDFHNIYRTKGELSTNEINNIWIKRQKQMFGDSVILSPEYSNWWMYIQHFTDSPFYVYAYAFGELFALGLLQKFENEPEKFSEKYREFLEVGSSKSPEEIGEIFGVDFNDAEFWRGGIKVIEKYIERARQIHAEIKNQK